MGIKIEDISTSSSKKIKYHKSILSKDINVFNKGFSNKSKEQFYAELSVLLNSGINLKMALDLVLETQKKEKDKKIIENLVEQIIFGSSLSEAMIQNEVFTPYEYNAIKIGEQTGELPRITNDLREYFTRKNELKRQLISSLSYPVFVLLTALSVVFFMLRYVVPMFEDIFKQNNVELPWITKIIVNASNFLNTNSILLISTLVIFIVLVRLFWNSHWFYKWIGKFQLKLPILGGYLKKIYLIQFTQAMALLTNAKIPVVTGINLTREMIRFYPLQKTLKVIEKDIIDGDKIYISFKKHSYYDKKMIALLKVAEETNQTEFIFQHLYNQYRQEVKYQGQIITNTLNFLLTILVGIIVGVILVAMYLPMFKLSSIIG